MADEQPQEQQQQQQHQQENNTSSALRDNIDRKGTNAYYFAHAKTANGPEWDGNEQPRLLGKSTSNVSDNNSRRLSSFDLKSNITSYAFYDDGKTVKLYISMDGVGEKCTEEDITLDHTENSFCLMIHNYKEGVPMCLSIHKLTAAISRASYKLKQDRVTLILQKVDPRKTWHTINDKGESDDADVETDYAAL
jgi:hypothetical protein